MKIGFGKDGLTLNSKKINPLNLSVNGHGIESDYPIKAVDPFEILSSLASIDLSDEKTTRKDKIEALQKILNDIL
ncbi:hypothetical protein CLPU_10c01160 [Gottschalkia purinilytica]|uniref:Uncharacterized protein n=1 Tax=Gottschalkia purinilytica TaxID=1503 RepID=A0A0L0W9E7_GOTPU|nr:hypothetical protein [Gottschalkia purinilytica]KNF08061.1 hypothetical protein CLPU_10c01160 [Gottschalkia purinilytica]